MDYPIPLVWLQRSRQESFSERRCCLASCRSCVKCLEVSRFDFAAVFCVDHFGLSSWHVLVSPAGLLGGCLLLQPIDLSSPPSGLVTSVTRLWKGFCKRTLAWSRKAKAAHSPSLNRAFLHRPYSIYSTQLQRVLDCAYTCHAWKASAEAIVAFSSATSAVLFCTVAFAAAMFASAMTATLQAIASECKWLHLHLLSLRLPQSTSVYLTLPG